MVNKRNQVKIPGNNTYTAEDLIDVLCRVPSEAKVRTMTKAGTDPEIIIWWDEEL